MAKNNPLGIMPGDGFINKARHFVVIRTSHKSGSVVRFSLLELENKKVLHLTPEQLYEQINLGNLKEWLICEW